MVLNPVFTFGGGMTKLLPALKKILHAYLVCVCVCVCACVCVRALLLCYAIIHSHHMYTCTCTLVYIERVISCCVCLVS